MSWGRSRFPTHNGPVRTPAFFARKPAPSTVVLSDGDDDSDDSSDAEVVIIHGTAAGEAAFATSKGNRSSSNVINIDDDEGCDFDTDDVSSDCEILDDDPYLARKTWEMAASRKKPPHGAHECQDAGATDIFAECHPVEDMSSFFRNASKYCSQNTSGGTKEGAQSSAGNANGVNGPSVPNAQDVQNNIGGSKDDHDQSSVLNVKECSMDGSEKASEGIQSPRPDENSASNFASANRGVSGISSTDRKDGSPPISVTTPKKVGEKIPEDVYSQKDQSPPEASYNTNIYSAQNNGPVRGKDLLQDPVELGRFVSVIGEREKHKESVEYKRAEEKEWASRQRQLQIQAEEAKKLRKRKKAQAHY